VRACKYGKTQNYNQQLSTASAFEFPCKPLLGPSPELMQPQLSLKVVQGSIVWRQHIREACWRWKWEVFGARILSRIIRPDLFNTVQYVKYKYAVRHFPGKEGKVKCSSIGIVLLVMHLLN
jgi:hypothetical protein